MEEKIFSVSEYLEVLNESFKRFKVKIMGEVTDVNLGPSGHVYFNLKDEKDQSIIKCIIWKTRYRIYGIELKDGLKVVAFGNPSIHGQYGFSFIAESIEHTGEGVLKKEYEKLKQKLAEEGVFSEEEKRLIPKYPQKVGVITSRKGAVLADFLNNLGKFGFQVEMIDSRVEGQMAIPDLLSAIKTFRKKDIDVLVIMRGGGDMESMLAFNSEVLVREVSGFPVPVLVGIGHHKDEPLVALAADLAVSTPTAVAHQLSKNWEEAISILDKQEKKIIDKYQYILDEAKMSINESIERIKDANYLIFEKYKKIEYEVRIAFQNFQNSLFSMRRNLNDTTNKLFIGINALFSRVNEKLKYIEKTVLTNDPRHQLELGYSIAYYKNKVLRKVKDVELKKEIDLQVSDGIINTEVKRIKESK